MWIGSLNAPHSISYIDDVARGLVVLDEQEQAYGEVWHIPAGEPLTGRLFIEMVCEQAGVSPNYGVYNRTMMRLAGVVSTMAREATENLYQFEESFIIDGSKFERSFGPFEITPHREAISATIDWYRSGRIL